jgi:hypothetical protein
MYVPTIEKLEMKILVVQFLVGHDLFAKSGRFEKAQG